MVLHPEKQKEAEAIFTKWGLDFAVVGKTTDDLRFRVLHHGDEVANLPIKELGDEAPQYDRPWTEPAKPKPVELSNLPKSDPADLLLRLLASPNHSSRRWVYEQYDTLIQGNSLQLPGGDAGVVRVDGHPTKALAFSADVTPRYCEADPFEGGKQAVAECWRNLTVVGADPLAVTDNLNFGNPEKPEIMGQFVGCVRGIGEACRALAFPIVSGNVSLYNETNGRAILPTPAIAGVGLIADWSKMARIGFAREGDPILLVGAPPQWGTWLGCSALLAECFGRDEGAPPPVDLEHERRVGDFVRDLIRQGKVDTAHDCSDGGIALALAEMAMAGKIGATVNPLNDADPLSVFFGEDQGRYLLALPQAELDEIVERAKAAGVSCAWIGTTGGAELRLGDSRPLPIEELRKAHESWFPSYMEG